MIAEEVAASEKHAEDENALVKAGKASEEIVAKEAAAQKAAAQEKADREAADEKISRGSHSC